MPLSTVQTLELFNEKASRVLDVLMSNEDFKKPGALVLFDDESGWDSVHVGPDDTTIEAAVLSLRFFCQDNEPTSLRRLAMLYSEIGGDHATRFDYVRSKLNRLLDSHTNICIVDGGPILPTKSLLALLDFLRV